MSENWQRKFGRTFYEFRYHDALFVALNSEDPPDSKPYRFGPEQLAWFKDVLQRNQDVRWTFVFMHKPAWTFPNDDPEQTGWNAVERALGERRFTIFAGHVHNYARFVRNSHDYIMLATTGGASKLRGKSEGRIRPVRVGDDEEFGARNRQPAPRWHRGQGRANAAHSEAQREEGGTK
jgi:3',5'-cyclic AMP phosphodiesterase CpdA